MEGLRKIINRDDYYAAVSTLIGKRVYRFQTMVAACSKPMLRTIEQNTHHQIATKIVFGESSPHCDGYDVFASRFVMYNLGLSYETCISLATEYIGGPLNLYGGFYICNMMQGNFRRITLSLRKRLIALLYGCKRKYGFYRDLRKLFSRIVLYLEVDYMFFIAGVALEYPTLRPKDVHEKTLHILKCGYHSLEFMDHVEKPMIKTSAKRWAYPWFRWRRGGPKKLHLTQEYVFRGSYFVITEMLISLGEYGVHLHKTHGFSFSTTFLLGNLHLAKEDPITCSELIKASCTRKFIEANPTLKSLVL